MSTRADNPDKPKNAKKRRVINRSKSIDLPARFSTGRDSAFKRMVLAPCLSWSGGPHQPTEATSSKSSLGDKRLVGPNSPEVTNLHFGSFREHFTFLVPRSFQQSVASNPAPLPGARWKYSVVHDETNDVADAKSPDPGLYLFGRSDAIEDLDMEDACSGSAYPPLVGGVDQTVRFSCCRSILNGPLLTGNVA
jgi:hypothetical protein